MPSNPSQSLTIRVSDHRDRPHDLEKDKTLRHCVTLMEILIFPWGSTVQWINFSCGRLRLVMLGYLELHMNTSVFLSVVKSWSLRQPLQQCLFRMASRNTWCIKLCGSTTERKMCFPYRGCSCVSHPKQSIDSSFLHRHMAFCVILAPEMNGGWWWWLVSTSPSVWNVRLFPLESNITRSWTFNTTQASHNPAVTHPIWLVRNEISSSLRTWVDSWTLRLNFWGRKEGGS